jgi:hypothetical protein
MAPFDGVENCLKNVTGQSVKAVKLRKDAEDRVDWFLNKWLNTDFVEDLKWKGSDQYKSWKDKKNWYDRYIKFITPLEKAKAKKERSDERKKKKKAANTQQKENEPQRRENDANGKDIEYGIDPQDSDDAEEDIDPQSELRNAEYIASEDTAVFFSVKRKLPLGDPAKKLIRAMTNGQCMMCGWPYQWSGGDPSWIGHTFYAVEKLYMGMSPEAYPRLFSSYQASHILHKHSRNIIRECWTLHQDFVHPLGPSGNSQPSYKHSVKEEANGNFNMLFEIIKNELPSAVNGPLLCDKRVLERNLRHIADNVTRQVCLTLDQAIATYNTYDESKNSLTNKEDIKKWLLQQCKAIDSQDGVGKFLALCEGWTHSACIDCNTKQTMKTVFEKSVLVLTGINRERTAAERFTTDITKTIASAATMTVGKLVCLKLFDRYQIDFRGNMTPYESKDVSMEDDTQKKIASKPRLDDNSIVTVLIDFLVVNTIQIATAFTQNVLSIYTFKGAHKQETLPHQRHRWQSATALLATATMHKIFETSLLIANAGSVSQLSVHIPLTFDQLW